MNEKIYAQAIANPKAVFLFQNMRFSLLTPRFIRIEYSPGGRFEDRPSQQFWSRNQPTPPTTVTVQKDTFHLETEHFTLNFHNANRGFHKGDLAFIIKDTETHFCCADPNPGLFPGTARTLDKTKGPIRLQPGYLSRSGWAVIDDTESLIFNSSGWIEPRSEDPDYQDLYILISGHDYAAALQDYQRIAGNVPLIPRFMLGNWWSRYWVYSQSDVKELVQKFRNEQIPLSIFVLDMDWHITKTGNACTGWTGFSWNRELFPDPQGLLRWLHEQGLKTTLNLHPAEGIFPHEERYAQAAQTLGRDPSQKDPIPFDIANAAFAEVYFDQLLHPLEKEGVDFWWLDWQQGNLSKMPNLDPLWWLNHLHFFDLGREEKKRPVIFSRWGGSGNHRYPIGFSGDTIISWEALSFQPYFTATSANAAYGWWSHDIGGHMRGTEDAELYVRWLQFGVLSPILRIHCTKDIFIDHQPWAFGAEVLRIARELLQFRHALIPYLYSMARRYEQDGLPLCTPLYYSWPEEENAYRTYNQYLFGNQLMAAPITAPMEKDLGLSRQAIWFPEGIWFDFFTGEKFAGPAWQIQTKALDEMPLFAKAGAIIPLQPKRKWGGIANPEEMELHIFAGGDGNFDLYEDDGETSNYRQAHFCITNFHSHCAENSLSITIEPAQGDISLIPSERTYVLLLRGLTRVLRHTLTINGNPQPVEGIYDESTFTYRVGPIRLKKAQALQLTITTSQPLLAQGPLPEMKLLKLLKLLKSAKLETLSKGEIYQHHKDLMRDIHTIQKNHRKLPENLLIAILETMTGAGYTIQTDPQGKRFLILTNPKGLHDFQVQTDPKRSPINIPSEGILIPLSGGKQSNIGIDYFGLVRKDIDPV